MRAGPSADLGILLTCPLTCSWFRACCTCHWSCMCPMYSVRTQAPQHLPVTTRSSGDSVLSLVHGLPPAYYSGFLSSLLQQSQSVRVVPQFLLLFICGLKEDMFQGFPGSQLLLGKSFQPSFSNLALYLLLLLLHFTELHSFRFSNRQSIFPLSIILYINQPSSSSEFSTSFRKKSVSFNRLIN